MLLWLLGPVLGASRRLLGRLYNLLDSLRTPRIKAPPVRHSVSAQTAIAAPLQPPSERPPAPFRVSKSTPFLSSQASSGSPLIPKTIWRRISDGPIVIGVCAMAKKAKSAPMLETLNRLTAFIADGRSEFRVITFPEEMILNEPVDKWPECEALIAFFSSGFPLRKAQAYAALRKPFVFNDLVMQELLFDRVAIYRKLEAVGVPVPHYLVHDGSSGSVVDEQEDYIEIDGKRLQKPIVEKPISGEDHDIRIYYPRSAGGGSKRLFRKVGDRSSQFYADEHNTRACDGRSYIYEELLQTEGTDVKVYAVGPEYAHGEARKSPVVDGKVVRNARGKELRYPLILTNDEKEIARKVVLAFGQTLCGFDLLRSGGKSYVCDVNGWSFVKDSHKFWTDSANLLRQYCLHAICPHHLERFPQGQPQMPPPNRLEADKGPMPPKASLRAPTDTDESELLCVVALTRHGDRTPKQKLKMRTSEPALLGLLGEKQDPRAELKIKKIRAMEELTTIISSLVQQRLLDCRRAAASQSASSDPAAQMGDDSGRCDEELDKLMTVQQVLQSHPFSGINRKVQIKPIAWEVVPAAEDGTPPKEIATEALFILKWGGELTALGEAQAAWLGAKFRNSLYPGDEVGGGVLRLHSTYRHDLKIYSSDEGRVQMTAAAFTKGFLDLEGALPPILASLVSKDKAATAMLDDTSEEGRAGMDRSKEQIGRLLNLSHRISPETFETTDVSPSTETTPGADGAAEGARGLEHGQIVDQAPAPELPNPGLLFSHWLGKSHQTPRQALEQLHGLVGDLVGELRERLHKQTPAVGVPRIPSRDVALGSAVVNQSSVANGETPHLQYGRWLQLYKDFYVPRKDVYDTSKIPDIYDNALYDMVHNEHLGLGALPQIFGASRTLASYVVPQEYGIEPVHKVSIGLQIAWKMLAKLLQDMLAGMDAERHMEERVHRLDTSAMTDVRSGDRHVRTRLYFTSESHIHSLFNVLRFGSEVFAVQHEDNMEERGVQSIFSDEARAKFDKLELGYLTHIVFRVLHKKQADPNLPSSYAVQVLVSQGVRQHIQTPATTRPPSPSSAHLGEPCKTDCEWHERPELLPNDMFISSRDDLTLEDVDNFLSYFLRTTPPPASSKATGTKDRKHLPSPLFKRKARSSSHSRVLDMAAQEMVNEEGLDEASAGFS